MNIYYVYSYLRQRDSVHGNAGTPYYIGKGLGKRAFSHHVGVHVPKDTKNIAFISESMTEADAFQAEMLLIHLYGRRDKGTGILLNHTDGGDGSKGHLQSDETKKWRSEQWKGENNPNFGGNFSKEHRENLSNALKGRTLSDECKRKMSLVRTGKKYPTRSEEFRQKMSKFKKGNQIWLGKTHTEESRKRIGAKKRGNIWLYHPETMKCKFVRPEDVSDYEQQGYVKGRKASG